MDTQSKSLFLTADDIANWLVMNFEMVYDPVCHLLDCDQQFNCSKCMRHGILATTKLPNSTHFVTDHALYFGYRKMDLTHFYFRELGENVFMITQLLTY